MSYNDSPTSALANGGIVGLKGSCAGYQFDLNPGEEVIIGKDPQMCSIVVDSAFKEVSRKHVSITYDITRDQYRVVDYSSNGTWANGQKLIKGQTNVFPAGTLIKLANEKNVFKLGIEAVQPQRQMSPPPQPIPQPVPQPMPQPAPQPIPQPVPQPYDNEIADSQKQQGGPGLAIASMVCGIISLVLGCCFWYITFFTTLLAIIFGAIALGKKTRGKGMAIAGLVCGIIALIPAIYVGIVLGGATGTAVFSGF